MGFRGCVWVGESFLNHDKWQIKLLSEFLFKSHSTFYENSKITNSLHCNCKIRVQECNGGGATSCQWCHVMSHDVISVIGRGGVCHRGGGVCHGKLTSLEPSNKRRFKFIFFEALSTWICFKFIQTIGIISLCIVCKYEANPCSKSFRKNRFKSPFIWYDITADDTCLGNGRHMTSQQMTPVLGMAGIQANFELWPIFCSIYLIPTLNLRPGLNLAAFFTYIVKLSAFKLLSFMAYTYNIQGW